jgi:chloramphenicol O-acetyltransferase type A
VRQIDLQAWPRRDHFELFRAFDQPLFSMCANVDVTAFHPFVRRIGASFTVAMVHAISRASNAIPEFRYRIRGDQVIEHESVDPGFAILVDADRFSFCVVEHADDFAVFARRAADAITRVRAHPDLDATADRDDVVYMSPIPWVSFTSFTHPMPSAGGDSIPRFAWGKAFEDGGTLKMPVAVQGHHAVMDGIHMGRYYDRLQEDLHHPELVLGTV